jgi:flavin reductase (DIM6/NTAB) family NADH-FMN oxidoreductase RutF
MNIQPTGTQAGSSQLDDASKRHQITEPAILYFGTPVILLSTTNEDGTANLAPMSSSFCSGWWIMLGLASSGKTAQNMRRTGEVVLNLPSSAQVSAVDRLALTTGVMDVPRGKRSRGYEYVPNKFARAGLTPVSSETVAPPRAAECPIALEAVVESMHGIADDDEGLRGALTAFEVRVQRVHAHPAVLLDGNADRIDAADLWNPLIMSFQHFYGLAERLHPSKLASIDEERYRSPDTMRGREASAMRGRRTPADWQGRQSAVLEALLPGAVARRTPSGHRRQTRTVTRNGVDRSRPTTSSPTSPPSDAPASPSRRSPTTSTSRTASSGMP